MNASPLQREHLEHLRRHMALLVARIESDCSELTDEAARKRCERTCAFAHDLLDKISMAEQVVIGQGQWNEVLARLEQRYEAGKERIDAMHAELERIEQPKAADGDGHPPSTGSIVGDAVADSFMHLS